MVRFTSSCATISLTHLTTSTKKAGGGQAASCAAISLAEPLGGPIIRDKTFAFGSYEGFREQRTTTLFDTFPSQALMQTTAISPSYWPFPIPFRSMTPRAILTLAS